MPTLTVHQGRARDPSSRPSPPRPSSLAAALVVAVAVGLLLGRFLFAGRSDDARPPTAERAPRSAEARVADLQARLRQHPEDARSLTRLALAYLDRYRESADPASLEKAGQAVTRSLDLDPSNPSSLTAAGMVALSRHDFGGALDWGRRAAAATPDAADPLGVVVDALVELGRYPEAVDAAQAMVDRRPSLPSLARVSYLRELHGDAAGAVAAMNEAITAGAANALDVAVAVTLLADLRAATGHLVEAEKGYLRALELAPGYGPAEVGVARMEAGRDDLAGAARRLERVVLRVPQAAWVALLGDVYRALGRPAHADDQYDLVRQIEQLNRASGVAVDLELARFEADHARDEGGNPQLAVELASAALRERPTIFAHDALAWALRQAGRPAEALAHARHAVRLGTGHGVLWYHLAAIEEDLGLLAEAREHVVHALTVDPLLTVRDLPEARALRARLDPGQ